MVVVCGIDFSGSSLDAARAAAALAARANEPLHLVHVLDLPDPGVATRVEGLGWNRAEDVLQPEIERRVRLLAEVAGKLESLGPRAKTEVLSGIPDQALAQYAERIGASLIVVASLGRRASSVWRLGSVADRLSQLAPVPVLVVRSAQPFEAWARDRKPLKVVLGLDRGPTCESAARWLSELRRRGPCDVVEAHVYSPPEELRRLGLAGPLDSPGVVAQIESALARELPVRAGELRGKGGVRFRALANMGRPADPLVELAEDERADLIVVGTHGRGALGRRMQGSVAYTVLPLATTNVVVVPMPPPVRATEPPRPASVRSVLVATDLSETGDRAIAHALALVGPGGKATLLHVVVPPQVLTGVEPFIAAPPLMTPAERAERDRELERALRQRISAREDGAETLVQVVEDVDVAGAICAAAERNGADVICLGTHGRGLFASALLGSVARDVVRRSHRPVLLVPPAGKG